MLPPGTRLGAYEIVALLGSGGMGEVYRARDPRLDRDVAIKVLPASVAADATALARFEREAMSVARLSHPNVVAIYEFARDAGAAFVAMELLDGQTLRARLADGPLPPRKAVAYALQIARGIAAAHARDIVHRDLKPENVMITRDDHVKILDFGLAKPVEAPDNGMTRTMGIATNAGTVLGTFGYMAPEQVRGQPVDRRADIFAFGAVLYELLTGQRAFAGDTAADSMSAVLTKEPPELDLAKLSITASLDRIIRRCLEKQPDLRFQSANDLAFALETLSGISSTPAASLAAGTSAASGAEIGARGRAASAESKPAAARLRWLPWSIAAAALAGAAFMATRPTRADEPHWSTFTRVTEAAGEENESALSPDGNTVAYSVKINGNWDIYAQRVGGRNAQPLVNDPSRNEGGAAFSPDGLQIAFHDDDGEGGIFIAGATGESVRRLTDKGFHPAWAPDGKTIAFTTERIISADNRLAEAALFIVDTAGGTPRKVVDGDAAQPSWSPNGARIVYWSNTGGQRDIYTVPAAGGARVALTNDAAIDWSPVWSPDGQHVYFSSDRGGVMNLWRVAVNESTGRATGDPEPVVGGVLAKIGRPSFSKNGTRIAFDAVERTVTPYTLPFDPATGKAGTAVAVETPNSVRTPTDVSPDGKTVAYMSLGDAQEDLFVGAPGDSRMRRVTDDAARDRVPVFTPDGKSLVFYSTRSGTWQVWMIGVDGGRARQLTNEPQTLVYPLISPSGTEMVFNGGDGLNIYRAPMTPTGFLKPTQLPNAAIDGRWLLALNWSPDGSKLAGSLAGASGAADGIGVYDLRAQQVAQFALGDSTTGVRWLPDGKRLLYFFRGGTALALLDTTTGKRTIVDVTLPAPCVDDVFALSRDGRTIYYGGRRIESDIWVVDRKGK